MVRRNLRSVLDDLLRLLEHGAFAGITGAETAVLEYHLRILRPAPEPHLAAGRQRVLAEAARLQECQSLPSKLFQGTHPRFSLALVAVASLLVVGTFATTTFGWNSAHSGNLIFGFFSTPTLAFTPRPVTEASEPMTNMLTPISNPTPLRIGMTLTAVPLRTPEPTIIPEPTRGPMLTMTRPAQAQPTY